MWKTPGHDQECKASSALWCFKARNASAFCFNCSPASHNCACLEMLGIEPRTSYMRSMRSTTELHPLLTLARQQREQAMLQRCGRDPERGLSSYSLASRTPMWQNIEHAKVDSQTKRTSTSHVTQSAGTIGKKPQTGWFNPQFSVYETDAFPLGHHATQPLHSVL